MTFPAPRRMIRAGVERLCAQPDLPRHQHHEAYATVVLKGSYEQAAYAGRFIVAAGDVIVQPTFDCHSDHMLSAGVELIRLPWRLEVGLGGVYDDLPVDEVRRIASLDVCEAAALLQELVSARRPRPAQLTHSADLLASALTRSPDLRIKSWAARQGLVGAKLSRRFFTRYGVHPARFRSEVRARRAWGALVTSRASCAAIAYELNFADQAHMSRDVRWLTGRPPSAWRSSALSLVGDA